MKHLKNLRKTWKPVLAVLFAVTLISCGKDEEIIPLDEQSIEENEDVLLISDLPDGTFTTYSNTTNGGYKEGILGADGEKFHKNSEIEGSNFKTSKDKILVFSLYSKPNYQGDECHLFANTKWLKSRRQTKLYLKDLRLCQRYWKNDIRSLKRNPTIRAVARSHGGWFAPKDLLTTQPYEIPNWRSYNNSKWDIGVLDVSGGFIISKVNFWISEFDSQLGQWNSFPSFQRTYQVLRNSALHTYRKAKRIQITGRTDAGKQIIKVYDRITNAISEESSTKIRTNTDFGEIGETAPTVALTLEDKGLSRDIARITVEYVTGTRRRCNPVNTCFASSGCPTGGVTLAGRNSLEECKRAYRLPAIDDYFNSRNWSFCSETGLCVNIETWPGGRSTSLPTNDFYVD